MKNLGISLDNIHQGESFFQCDSWIQAVLESTLSLTSHPFILALTNGAISGIYLYLTHPEKFEAICNLQAGLK